MGCYGVQVETSIKHVFIFLRWSCVMTTLDPVTVSVLHQLLRTAGFPHDSRLPVMFEEDRVSDAFDKHTKTISALQQLRGSGSGNQVRALLGERVRDRL